MALTQKCLYALRAVLELALREEEGPARVADIASAQDIPPRFLEVIMNELRQGGFAESRRGKEGGYTLARPAGEIRVGDIIRFIEGSLAPAGPSRANGNPEDPVFQPIWDSAEAALTHIYDNITIHDIAHLHRQHHRNFQPDFMI